MIISPCISICKTDPVTGYCYGCGRSNEEKKIWKLENTTNEWKTNNKDLTAWFEKFIKNQFMKSTVPV